MEGDGRLGPRSTLNADALSEAPADVAAAMSGVGGGGHVPANVGVTAEHVRGLPRTCSIGGGVCFIAGGLFPWFTAGAIASDPLRGRALIALVVGLIVVGVAIAAVRAPAVWQTVTGAAALIGAGLAISTVVPPTELSPSLGAGLGLVGTVLAGVAVFAARWRHRWTAPKSDTADPATGEGEADRPTWRQVASGGAIAVAIAIAFVVVWPASTPSLASHSTPAASHGEAVARFETVVAAETDLNVFEPCTSRLLTHGQRTEVAVVLFHGLTNCPRQFVEFASELYDDGANVVILRAPEHGIANDDGTEIGGVANVSDLTSEALQEFADESIDIGLGLGAEVRVLGLSMGGVIAAWSAQERDDVARVVAVAPAMTIPRVPASLTRVFRNIFDKLPNLSLPSAGTTLDHAYAGESTKGLDATFEMGGYVAGRAYRTSPASPDVIVVVNPDDDQVDADHVSRFANAWAARGGQITLYRLPKLGLPHDVIDVGQPEGNTEIVYPILIDLLGGESS